ncbi:MAG: DUF1573 domain-containing protein [Phycisphaerales bacterium]
MAPTLSVALGAAALSLGSMGSIASAQPMRPDEAPRQGAQPVQPGQVQQSGPPFRLRVEQVDFGTVRPHIESRTTLELFNASKFPITLSRVTATCSCMGGIVEGSEVISPGQVGKVDITVKGRANPGPIRERVTVWYIDPESGRERNFGIPVTGEVAEAVKVEPFFVNLLLEKKSGSLALASTDGERFRVLSFAGKDPVFDPAAVPEGETPGRDATTKTAILYDFSDVPETDLPDFALLQTDHPEAPLITVRLVHRGMLMRGQNPAVRPWSLSQDSFNLQRLASGESIERTITVVAPRLGDTFEATTSNERLGVEVVEVTSTDKGKEVRLRFTMQSGDPGVLRESVTLKNGPDQMSLPVFALHAAGA